jgi:hypothetical protein
MKLGTALTIHGNILGAIAGAGFIEAVRGDVLIGSVLLLTSGIYGNLLARYISKKIKKEYLEPISKIFMLK